MGKVRIIVSFELSESVDQDALAKMVGFAKSAKLNPGCEQIELVEDLETPGHFAFVELWKSTSVVEEHTKSDYFKEFVAFLAAHVKNLKVRKMQHILA